MTPTFMRGSFVGAKTQHKFSGAAGKLALRELEAFAGSRLAGLLAFFFPGIALEVAGLFQRGSQLGVEFLQGAGDAVGHGAGLAPRTTAGYIARDVELVPEFDGQQRRV